MEPWQLVVYRDEDVLELSVSAVRSARPGSASTIRAARHLLTARKLVESLGAGACDLLVIGSSTPEDAIGDRGEPSREPTKKFIRWLKEANTRIPVIVLSITPDEKFAGFLDAFDFTSMIKFDDEWRDALIREASVQRPASAQSMDYLELEIVLDDCKSGHWWMRRRGKKPFEDTGTLPLAPKIFNRIVRHSTALDGETASDSWRGTLEDLSEDLEELLFGDSNRPFWKKFVLERSDAGGLARTWLRFGVSQDTQDAFLEAVKEYGDTEHWMLTVPIFRKYPPAGQRLPLFKDVASRQGKIDCLIIEADREGGVVTFGEGETSLATLPNVEHEARDIARLLNLAHDRNQGVGVVKHVRIGDEIARGHDPVHFVLDLMRNSQWHLIHFAGHAVHSRNEAALVLSADRNSVLPINTFSKHVVAAQFIFLSCCRSAHSSLIMRMAEQAVPAILGFRWRVDDAGAASFAHAFYTELFNPGNPYYKYLEYAFRDARKYVYDSNSRDPTWASPMLVLQMKQAEAGAR
jgi:hypothetical protein